MTENLYRPPDAELHLDQIPAEFLNCNLKPDTFSRSGWIAVFYFLCQFPLLFFFDDDRNLS
jgi:hypothetical protein